jgi:hypothetical protein
LASYITTADAISKYFSDDPEWRRLSEAFHSIARVEGERRRQPKDVARDELKKREDYLFDNVYQAVVRQELQVLLMDGSRTFQLPGLYIYDTYEMADALRSGWAGKLTLTGPDTIWKDARLVFTDANWQQIQPQREGDSSGTVATVQRTNETPAMAAPAGERLPAQASDAVSSQSDGGTGLERVRAAMDAIKADRKQLRRADFEEMVRKFVGPRTNAATLGALWLELAPEGWRRPGQGSPPAGLMVDWKGFLSRK